jgi:hypothetical protein
LTLRPWLAACAAIAWIFVAAIIAAVVATGPASAQARTAPPLFKRGATLVEFFQFPQTVSSGSVNRYADPAYPNAAAALALFDFDALRADGFDHMRLPLDIGPLLAARGAQWNEIMSQLRAVIAALHRHGLGVVVTLLPPAPGGEIAMPQLDGIRGSLSGPQFGPHFEHYVAIVERIAVELAAIKSGVVALEPMNEPQTECRARTGSDWTAYQEVMVPRIRRLAPDLPLFLTGGCWSSIEGTVLLDTPLLHDPRNYVSVHFYIPFVFTHQTATWAMPFLAGMIGVPYPAAAGKVERTLAATQARFAAMTMPAETRRSQLAEADSAIRWYFTDDEGRATIEQWMDKLADWQAREGVRPDHILFTEFGAMKQLADGVETDRDSRSRWLHDASATIAGHGWGWTVFVLRDGPFGLYDSASDRRPDPGLLRALGLSPVSQ